MKLYLMVFVFCLYSLSVLAQEFRTESFSEALLQKAEAGDAISQLTVGASYYEGSGIQKDYSKAAHWYKKAAEQGNAWAEYFLAGCYINGEGVEKNQKEAIYWLLAASKSGLVPAQNNLALIYQNGEGVEKNPAEASIWLKKAADTGNGVASFNLAKNYEEGLGVGKDLGLAVLYFEKALQNGVPDAKDDLLRVKQDLKQAGSGDKQLEYTDKLLKRAESGDLKAQLDIAECYDKGLGVQKNPEKADFWFKKIQEQANKKTASINKTIDEVVKVADETAEKMKGIVANIKEQYSRSRIKAEQGDQPSQLIVGLAHLDPDSTFVPYDKNEAYKWIKKAADSGNICGKYLLARFMREGIGTPINTDQAMSLMAQIDNSASPAELAVLGVLLFKGCDYLNNKEEGINYLSKAAERGDVNAQLFLSDYFCNTDPKQFAKWTKKASDQGNAVAQASLGMALIMGRGVPENKTQGIQLLKESAGRSNPAGMYGLGVCLINGNGIKKDVKQGVKLIKSAANSGFQAAVEWIQKNPDKISKAQMRYEEVKEQLQFYKDLNPEDKKAKENRQDMINQLITEENRLSDQMFRENQAH